ncbi:MAG: GatB/YqeY domain-containing protein [Pseudomonadota bacterium]
MSMRDRINSALKSAMKDKDQLRVSTLRLVNAAIKEREIALRGNDDGAELDGAGILQILSKMVKQREESAKAYDDAKRDDLASRERAEIKVIREFMPKPLSDDDVAKAVADAIKDVGADSIKDMGKVMGALKSKYTGRMDFGKAGAAVKDALA